MLFIVLIIIAVVVLGGGIYGYRYMNTAELKCDYLLNGKEFTNAKNEHLESIKMINLENKSIIDNLLDANKNDIDKLIVLNDNKLKNDFDESNNDFDNKAVNKKGEYIDLFKKTREEQYTASIKASNEFKEAEYYNMIESDKEVMNVDMNADIKGQEAFYDNLYNNEIEKNKSNLINSYQTQIDTYKQQLKEQLKQKQLIYYQYDYVLNTSSNLPNQPIKGSVTECSLTCYNDPLCVGFSRKKNVTDTVIDECWLKKEPTGNVSFYDTTWQTFVKPSIKAMYPSITTLRNVIKSIDYRCQFILQNNGIAIIKNPYKTIWSSASTGGTDGTYRLVISANGELRILNSSDTIVWRSNIVKGASPYKAVMGNDCNFVISDANNTIIWQTGTSGRQNEGAPAPPPPPPPPSYSLPSGSYSQSCSNCSYNGTTLTCSCRTMSGSYRTSSKSGCSVYNNNDGYLTC